MRIRNLLAPVDFSPTSRKALDFGVSLASTLNADLIVAGVIEPRILVPFIPGTEPEPGSSSPEGVLERLRALVPDQAKGSVNCRFVVREGHPEEEILSIIAAEEVDIAVLGTHGRRGFRSWLLGSVAEHLLRTAPVPVITVSHPEEEYEPWPIRGGLLAYASDASVESSRGLGVAFELSQRLHGELAIVHAVPPAVESWSTYPPIVDHESLVGTATQRLEASLPDELRGNSGVHVHVVEGRPYEAIIDTATRLQSNLIVVNLHGSHRTERAALGATAERIVRNSPVPVLSLPAVD